MTVGLVSENEKRGTVLVVVVTKGGSTARHMKFVSERKDPKFGHLRFYEDKDGNPFVRLGNHFSSVNQ